MVDGDVTQKLTDWRKLVFYTRMWSYNVTYIVYTILLSSSFYTPEPPQAVGFRSAPIKYFPSRPCAPVARFPWRQPEGRAEMQQQACRLWCLPGLTKQSSYSVISAMSKQPCNGSSFHIVVKIINNVKTTWARSFPSLMASAGISFTFSTNHHHYS